MKPFSLFISRNYRTFTQPALMAMRLQRAINPYAKQQLLLTDKPYTNVA